jgi:hypothetical protein
MNTREQFLALMDFQPGVPAMKWEMGFWAATLRRWYSEGLSLQTGIPNNLADGDGVPGMGTGWTWGAPRAGDVDRSCGLDAPMERLPLNVFACPAYPDEIVEDHGNWVIRRLNTGVLRKEWADRRSLPHDVGWPVHSRHDWERYKADRLRPVLTDRLPDTWPSALERYKSRTAPLVVGGYGFYSTPRLLLGEENLLYLVHDDPELVRTIINDLCDFWIALYDQVLGDVPADVGQIWEDMSYNHGPLISPAMAREFMLPAYKRLTAFWRDHGIKVVLLDTDGDCWSLISILLEGGITGIYPFEVRAGMDVVAVRKAFPRLQIIGGIDKMRIATGSQAIDDELQSRIPYMLQHGGYIPCLDHYVPPDVSWPDFVYYRGRLASMMNS